MREANDYMTEVAMQIIVEAGNARTASEEALALSKNKKFIDAEEKFILSKRLITKAHQYQTEVIQNSFENENIQLSLLFIHAQDTLMTIKSEINLHREISDLYKLIKLVQE